MSLLPLIQGGVSSASAFDPASVENSIWFDGSADFLIKTFGSGAAQSRVVISQWVQRCKLSTQQTIIQALNTSSAIDRMFFTSSTDKLHIQLMNTSSTTTTYESDKVFKDVGWYHILMSFDGNESGTDTLNVFVNGTAITMTKTFGSDTTGSLAGFGGANAHRIGCQNTGGGAANNNFFKGYQAQCAMIVGKSIQAGTLQIGDFLSSSDDRFIPKTNANIAALATAAGGNSYCLDFANSSDLGNDISSNTNDFTPTSMSTAQQVAHSPSSQFPIFSFIGSNDSSSLNDNMEFGNRLNVGVSDWRSAIADKMFGTSGNWYVEVRMHTETASNGMPIGIMPTEDASGAFNTFIGTGFAQDGYSQYSFDNRIYHANGTQVLNAGATCAAGDILQLALDLENNAYWFGKNNTYILSGNPATNSNSTVPDGTTLSSGLADVDWVFGNSSSATEDYFVNFGQDSTFGGLRTAGNQTDGNSIGDFAFAPPSGFLALFQSNMPDLTFANPATGSFTGNANAFGPFVYLGFQPSPSDALTINSNAVTYGTHANLCNNGFKVISSSSSYNSSGTNTYSLVTANALQINGSFPPPYGILN